VICGQTTIACSIGQSFGTAFRWQDACLIAKKQESRQLAQAMAVSRISPEAAERVAPAAAAEQGGNTRGF
jgi:hypothetical protein